MTTLCNIALAVYVELGRVLYGTATGGSTTSTKTVVDSALLGENDNWNGGVLFLTYDVAGTGVAPEGEYARITDYVAATGTITLGGTPTLSAYVTSGDQYALGDPKLKIDKVIGFINAGLRKIGRVPDEDVSLTTASGQTEYTLPTAVKGGRLRRVFISQSTDTNDYGWRELADWYEAPGATNDLIFRSQPDTSQTLKLVYMAAPTPLTVYSSTISTSLDINRVVAEAIYLYYKSIMRTTEGRSDILVDNMRDAIQELDNARKMYRVIDPGTPMKPVFTSKPFNRLSRYGFD